MRLHCYLLLCGLALSVALSAQDGRVRFTNFSAQSGLASSQVNGLARDRDGYLWIATAAGVRRFDGYRFRAYRAAPEVAGALPDNSVQCVFVDRGNRKWFGTQEGGIARFDPATSEAVTFTTGDL